jgi:hypothetical protein
MILDPELMAYGAGAFGVVYATQPQAIILGAPIIFDSNQNLLNVDHNPGTAGLIVRQSGTYQVVCLAQTLEPSQFGIYINGILEESTVSGINVGSTQLILRQVLKLKKHDVVTVRNWISAIGTVNLDTGAGGLTGSTNTLAASLLVSKIAPYCTELPTKEKATSHLFETLLHKLGKDRNLALGKDYVAYGSFWRTTPQTLNVEDPVIFEMSQGLKNIDFTDNTSDIKIKSDGEYFVAFTVGPNKSAQFTFFINGQPQATTTTGIDAGATQLLMRAIIELRNGDILSVRNHTSVLGTITFNPNGGGLAPGIDAGLTIYKISPLISQLDKLCFWNAKEEYKHMNNNNEDERILNVGKFGEIYHEFKEYLVWKDIARGTHAFFSGYNAGPLTISLEQAVNIYINKNLKNFKHIQGLPGVIVTKDGAYLIVMESYSDSPAQFSVYVNGVLSPNSTSGTDSGSGLCSLRQIIVTLQKGDVITIVNHTSGVGDVILSENQGGNAIGINFTLVLLHL